MILKSDEEQLKRLRDEYLSLRQEQSERLVALERLLNTPEETELFKVVQNARAGYTQAVNRVIDLVIRGEHDQAIRLLYGDLEQAQEIYATQLDAMVAMQEASLAKVAPGNGERIAAYPTRALQHVDLQPALQRTATA